MAGIGFALRKLLDRDDLGGVARAFGSATMVACGPWLLTILGLGLLSWLTRATTDDSGLLAFQSIVTWNFAVSLILSAPFFMVLTRALADRLYVRDATGAPALLLETLTLVAGGHTLLGGALYFGWFHLPAPVALGAVVNMGLVSALWILSVFLSALRSYGTVGAAFAAGMAVAVGAAVTLKSLAGPDALIWGFNLGLTVTAFTLSARVFAEYPYRFRSGVSLWPFGRRYWDLAVGATAYNLGLWIDKFIMWGAPEAVALPSGFVFFNDYDKGMFLACLTIAPIMGLFVFTMETSFFAQYRKFYADILRHATLAAIRANHEAMLQTLQVQARLFVALQAAVAALAIAGAPALFQALGLPFSQIGIFRFGVLGAFFHVLLMFAVILLAYFESRRMAMGLQILFLALNAGLTLAVRFTGVANYGAGYFLAAMLSFAVAALCLSAHLRRLPYHAFITNNESVTGRRKESAKGTLLSAREQEAF